MPSKTLDTPVRLSGVDQSAADLQAQADLKARGPIPAHIACIMDGNGRWANEKGKPRVIGHREGVVSVRDITEACAQIGVEHLTLYTFSTENWHRPAAEVTALMELLVRTIRKEADKLHRNGIRLHAIGDLGRLPARGQRELKEALDLTAGNTRMTLTLALSYGSRWEITEAVRAIAEAARAGTLDPADITEESVSEALLTRGLPDPDLLVRTAGEMRLSNFLLWQVAYTELYVTEKYWPAFRREALYDAIRSYQGRDRRFGRVADA
ncbi:di-trans,poly-cis-decaprenylcistransferase [Rubrivirga sp. SAORIC476]|mgnify:FL=1|uniref:isoprenyl transferase n=1 Tax=Rubrivirga sp. SAORIC476 TaxID=1961794 RepID=UPI000BA8DA02|nr:isoprenyl transferase [Rubrivirga sp. SAORIC476]MAQ92987.1 isoprenyl transferase [Rhodothermaceae bacterium]MBC13896.1 isoprenyl transferase [Rhodothermaceae bacterium]PAP74877.1 di-trans,poly-cis-decaprenylcistransferase [Rubrivirga sp. SAORIC476]